MRLSLIRDQCDRYSHQAVRRTDLLYLPYTAPIVKIIRHYVGSTNVGIAILKTKAPSLMSITSIYFRQPIASESARGSKDFVIITIAIIDTSSRQEKYSPPLRIAAVTGLAVASIVVAEPVDGLSLTKDRYDRLFHQVECKMGLLIRLVFGRCPNIHLRQDNSWPPAQLDSLCNCARGQRQYYDRNYRIRIYCYLCHKVRKRPTGNNHPR